MDNTKKPDSFSFNLFLFISVLFLISAPSLFACQGDYDCSGGASCILPEGEEYGVCVGGQKPGNSNDGNIDRDPVDADLGITCYRNADCFPGKLCFKSKGAYLGACIYKAWLRRPDVQELKNQ